MIKVKRYIEACHTCLKTKPKCKKNRPVYSKIPVEYFTIAVPLRDRQTQTVAKALIYRVIYLFSPPRQIVCGEATEFTSAIVQAILMMLNCRLKVISPYNHGSSKCERQINFD